VSGATRSCKIARGGDPDVLGNAKLNVEDVVTKIRQKDREKKQKSRNASTSLVQKLEHTLSALGHSSGPRTLHETLDAACSAVRVLRCGLMLRRGMLSQLGSGLMLVDAESASVVEANDFILSRVGKTASAVSSAPLSSIFSASSAEEAGIILRQLSRNRGNDEPPHRFELGINLCHSTHNAVSICAEFLRCSPSSGGRPLFIVNVMPSRPLVDPASEVLRALRRLAGFRPEETCVTYVHAATPIAWASSSRPKAPDECQKHFHIAVDGILHNGNVGNDFAPVAAPWVVDFLLRGAVFGQWCGLREWLSSNEAKEQDGVSDFDAKRIIAVRAIESLSSTISARTFREASDEEIISDPQIFEPEKNCLGPKGHARRPKLPGTRLEMRSEAGTMCVSMLVRGLCVFEFRVGSMGILPTLMLPSYAQSRLKECTVPLEQLIFEESSKTAQTTFRVREDGAVWGHVEPSPSQFSRLFGLGAGGRFHVCICIENDVPLAQVQPGALVRGRDSDEIGSSERNSDGFRFCKFLLKGDQVFTAVRRWVRASPRAHKYAQLGGLEVRNALLEMYNAMRRAVTSAAQSSDKLKSPSTMLSDPRQIAKRPLSDVCNSMLTFNPGRVDCMSTTTLTQPWPTPPGVADVLNVAGTSSSHSASPATLSSAFQREGDNLPVLGSRSSSVTAPETLPENSNESCPPNAHPAGAGADLIMDGRFAGSSCSAAFADAHGDSGSGPNTQSNSVGARDEEVLENWAPGSFTDADDWQMFSTQWSELYTAPFF